MLLINLIIISVNGWPLVNYVISLIGRYGALIIVGPLVVPLRNAFVYGLLRID